MKITLRSIGIVGILLFGALFSITFGMPTVMEKSAKGFIVKQIEKEILEKFQNSKAASITDKALVIANRFGYEEKQIKENLKNKLPEKIASILASMCGYDCEKKKAVAKSITKGYVKRIANIHIAKHRLGDIIKGKYLEIVGKLKTDLRIFLGSNTLLFGVLLAVSFFRPRAITQLFLPCILLLLSTIAASSIYIFGQNWFYTILYSDYVGFGYLAYIGIIFGFFMDIVFNKARVTTQIIQSIIEGIGSGFSVSPC